MSVRAVPGATRHLEAGRVVERGSGSVLVLACCATLTLVLVGASALTGVVRDAHGARAAADLAALAAAGPLATGGAPDCARAGMVADLNGAALSSCVLLPDGSVVAGIDAPVGSVAGGVLDSLGVLPSTVSARSRAGVVGVPGTGD